MLASIEDSVGWFNGGCETPVDLLFSMFGLPSLDSSVADVVRVGVDGFLAYCLDSSTKIAEDALPGSLNSTSSVMLIARPSSLIKFVLLTKYTAPSSLTS